MGVHGAKRHPELNAALFAPAHRHSSEYGAFMGIFYTLTQFTGKPTFLDAVSGP